MSKGEPGGSYPGGSTPAVAMDTDETAEDRRVMALANDLRISSAISPHDLMSLRTTTPLESDDGLDDEEEDDGQEGKEEEQEAEDPSGRAVTGFFPRRCAPAVFRSLCCMRFEKV